MPSNDWRPNVIQLHSHCLVFETSDGELIPCDAEDVTIELIGDAVQNLDPNVIRQAAAAVLHYFKAERQQEIVTIREFTAALETVLRGFGLKVVTGDQPKRTEKIAEADLSSFLATELYGHELEFFAKLKEGFFGILEQSPNMVQFNGLRRCVKRLVGAQRWCNRCRDMNDHIIVFLRGCLDHSEQRTRCALVVR